MLSKISMLLLIAIFTTITYNSCKENDLVEKGDPNYIKEINDWHAKRVERLTKKDSWLSLAGLFWLKQGENTFGSDKTNDIVFPEGKSADFMGIIILTNNEVSIKVKEGIEIKANDENIIEAKLAPDVTGKPTRLTYGPLTWFVIVRGEKIGIRLRNSENSAITDFKGIPRYPVNDDWNITAKWEVYEPPKLISIPSVLGTVSTDTAFGAVAFTINNKLYKLDALGKKENLFIIFADQTNGYETYGAGRFISAKRNLETGEVLLDFNKAYNPPCAFTKYATCPLPPEQNQLPVKVTAGEKFEGHQH